MIMDIILKQKMGFLMNFDYNDYGHDFEKKMGFLMNFDYE